MGGAKPCPGFTVAGKPCGNTIAQSRATKGGTCGRCAGTGPGPALSGGPSVALAGASLTTVKSNPVTYRDLRVQLESLPGVETVQFHKEDSEYIRSEFSVRFSDLRWSDGDPRAEETIIAAVRAVREILAPHKFNFIRYSEKGWVDAQQRKDR